MNIDGSGLKLKRKEKEPEYYNLGEMQRLFYDEAELEFEEAKIKIANATKKSQLSKITERTIVKSRVAEKLSNKLSKNINHSTASKENCNFLFDRINRWNKQLKAQYVASSYSAESFKTKDEIKIDLKRTENKFNKQQTEIDIAELEFMADALLLPAQSELKNKIARLENENHKLHIKVATLESQREQYLKQLSNELEVQKIKQENIKLRTLLGKIGVDY